MAPPVSAPSHPPPPPTVQAFLLEQELPGLEEAVRRAEASLLRTARLRFPPPARPLHPIPDTAVACTCPHLRSLFPDALPLSGGPVAGHHADPAAPGEVVHRGTDPVAALHLRSQWDDDDDTRVVGTTGAPVYGDEEERRNLVCRPGFPEFHHPYLLEDAATPPRDPSPARPVADEVVRPGGTVEDPSLSSSSVPRDLSAMAAAAHGTSGVVSTTTPPGTAAPRMDHGTTTAAALDDATVPGAPTAVAVLRKEPEEEHAAAHVPGGATGADGSLPGTTMPVWDPLRGPAEGNGANGERGGGERGLLPMALAASANVPCDHAASCDTAAVASTEAAYALPEATFWQYQRREEQILQLRQNFLSKRSKRKHYPPPPPPPPPWTVRATPPPLPEETVRCERARHAWYQQRQKEVVAQSERLL
jgi:hypothetical protein